MPDPDYKSWQKHPTVFEAQQLIEQAANGGKVPTTTTKTPIDTIKETLGMLQSFGFNYLFAEFDGSGDSGDFDHITLMPKKPDGPNNATIEVNENHKRSFHAFKHETLENARTKLQKETIKQQLDRFESALWQILPNGWEIDDGSFGELQIDIANKTIHMVANERISEVHTYERDL